MFLLEKFFGVLCMPMPILSVLFIIGLSMLWFTKRQVMAKLTLTLTTLLLVFTSSGSMSSAALAWFENLYPPA